MRGGADWAGRPQSAGSALHLPEAGSDVPLDDLYEGVDLTPAQNNPPAA